VHNKEKIRSNDDCDNTDNDKDEGIVEQQQNKLLQADSNEETEKKFECSSSPSSPPEIPAKEKEDDAPLSKKKEREDREEEAIGVETISTTSNPAVVKKDLDEENELQTKEVVATTITPSKKIKSFFGIFGPGLVTGASDDDPSGIATYSQAGAQFGLGMLWLAIFQYPLMTAIQEMCARIGLVTGSGLGAIIKKRYSKRFVYPLAGLLLVANTINIGADIGAMAASVRLILPQIPFIAATLGFTAFILLSEILIPYQRYVRILKYLTLFLFAYVITTIIVGGNAYQIVSATFVPHVELSSDFAMMFVAIFGTTISPYLFFWQASHEAEEEVADGRIREVSSTTTIDGSRKPKVTKREVKLMRADVATGMAISQLIMWAIVITTAGSLHSNGLTNIATAEEAAKALEPLVKTFPYSGMIAKTIFALGVIGTGLLAVPVLAGSNGYALSDAFGWRQGLSKKFGQAKYFYAVIAASTIIGVWINFTNIDPIKALVYTAVINGVAAVPILFAIMRIANDRKVLGDKTNRRPSNILGWITFVVMGIATLIMFATWGK
jgi:NRAMP (natural resistance-associated macrophage protein)-like metal ion transporter